MSRTRLLHIHLGKTTYASAAALQKSLLSAHLSHKSRTTLIPISPLPTLITTQPPEPTVITSEFHPPVYTLGRRESQSPLTPERESHLRVRGAELQYTPRGGLTTFHGPGQLTAYVIADLRHHGLRPRCYIRTLERALVATCAQWGIRAFTTEDTGAWTSENRKIGAVGVHMRRFVSSFGVGLNVSTDLWWFDRIVACGLEGKGTTSFVREGVVGVGVEEVGDRFVKAMAESFGCTSIGKKSRKDIPPDLLVEES
ncbi:unnamed protein product [Tuber melanosporum]|uniref:Octanoyltransferase n=1 Tax=Tuber melanosporum (strain Mel28) TaxID=656061 RepID=D5GCM3_TUBMM|nr:uncharacterized protein GSTUM_00000727001 [Tuber melanosporum]CAZ82266.1 unnamed protein product [Tuber melanosporum]